MIDQSSQCGLVDCRQIPVYVESIDSNAISQLNQCCAFSIWKVFLSVSLRRLTVFTYFTTRQLARLYLNLSSGVLLWSPLSSASFGTLQEVVKCPAALRRQLILGCLYSRSPSLRSDFARLSWLRPPCLFVEKVFFFPWNFVEGWERSLEERIWGGCGLLVRDCNYMATKKKGINTL